MRYMIGLTFFVLGLAFGLILSSSPESQHQEATENAQFTQVIHGTVTVAVVTPTPISTFTVTPAPTLNASCVVESLYQGPALQVENGRLVRTGPEISIGEAIIVTVGFINEDRQLVMFGIYHDGGYYYTGIDTFAPILPNECYSEVDLQAAMPASWLE